MSVREIKIRCDTPRCGAYYQISASSIDDARSQAAERWGWDHLNDDSDICPPCQRGETPDRRNK